MSTPNFGVFGGLFDPPHIGHLLIAQWVLEEFNLKKIIFVPGYNPPHKERYSSYDDRYEMTRLAIRNNKDFLLSDVEKSIEGKTYTVEVIRRLKKSLFESYYSKWSRAFLSETQRCRLVINGAKAPIPDKKRIQLYLIIGADQWQEIKTWKNPEELFNECKIVVLPRPGYKIKKIKPLDNKILISNSPPIDISSTMIRERIKMGLSIRYLVPEYEVLRYVIKHKLYHKA